MTECWIIELTDRSGAPAFTSVVDEHALISSEIARCAGVLGERFLSATIHHWQKPNGSGERQGWLKREAFEWH